MLSLLSHVDYGVQKWSDWGASAFSEGKITGRLSIWLGKLATFVPFRFLNGSSERLTPGWLQPD